MPFGLGSLQPAGGASLEYTGSSSSRGYAVVELHGASPDLRGPAGGGSLEYGGSGSSSRGFAVVELRGASLEHTTGRSLGRRAGPELRGALRDLQRLVRRAQGQWHV